MKLNLKKLGVETEADVEGLIEKGMDNHEKDWKEKFDTKHEAKKEILEMKHKHKMEEKGIIPIPILEEKIKDDSLKNNKKGYLIASIIFFFIFGLFSLTGFNNEHIVAAVVSVIQLLLLVLSILSSLDILSLFKNDYRVYFIFSLLLIIAWMAFAL